MLNKLQQMAARSIIDAVIRNPLITYESLQDDYHNGYMYEWADSLESVAALSLHEWSSVMRAVLAYFEIYPMPL